MFPRSAIGLVAAGCCLLPGAAAAQSRAAGRVVRLEGQDTIPVGGIAVVLHQVGPRFQGPVDTAATSPSGRFFFRFTPDSGSAYLLSARYAGIEYFSAPVASNPAQPDTGVVVIVADTAGDAPISVRQRTILVSAPDESGTRSVLDWFVISNTGQKTRVAADTTRSSWGTPLPPEAQNVELADNRMSQFSPDALAFRRDSAIIFAPLSPGDKELMLQYHIPGTLKRFVVPADRVTDSVFVLLEETGGSVIAPGFVAADSQMLDGRSFRRWAGPFPARGELVIALPSKLLSSKQALALLVGLFAAGFLTLAGLLLRRRGAAVRAGPLPRPAFLADAIARLDARYQDKEGATPAPEWASYLAERARLRALLERALASGRRRS